jgi:tetratricopeptide (TPR) repeat protein
MSPFSPILAVHKWWKTWNTLPVWSWERAASHYRAGRFEIAERLYRLGLKRKASHPAHFCARLDLAYCLFKLGHLEDAEHNLRYVTTHLPASREAFVRLARLQMWSGHALEAAWTIRRALRSIDVDPELAALFLFAVLENGGPGYLLDEAIEANKRIETEGDDFPRLQAARARLEMVRGQYDAGREVLEKVAESENAPFESIVVYAEVLLAEGEIALARRHLRRAMAASPDYPRVLSLLAETYLKSGDFYNGEYAKQLAIGACQLTNWTSPREMHVLAESYYHTGDRISALVVASKAKQAGTRLMGTYRGVRGLDQLIESLSSGTQA